MSPRISLNFNVVTLRCWNLSLYFSCFKTGWR